MYPPWLQPMQATFAGSTQPFGDEVIDAGDHVPRIADAEVAHVECAELLAVTGAAAIVHLEDERAARRPDVRRVVTRVGCQQSRTIDARRPAVNDAQQRIAFGGIEVSRLDQHAFDRRAVLALPGDHLARAEHERSPPASIRSRQRPRRERLHARHEQLGKRSR